MTLADKLRPYVEELKAEAGLGGPLATQIITWYEMHRTCPGDPGAPVVCEQYFNEWLGKRR